MKIYKQNFNDMDQKKRNETLEKDTFSEMYGD